MLNHDMRKAYDNYVISQIEWGMTRFSSFNKPNVPDHGGVYLILSEVRPNGKYDVIYAGKANDIRRRFGEHLNSDDHNFLTARHFAFSQNFPTEQERDVKEAALIRHYNPPCNQLLKRSL